MQRTLELPGCLQHASCGPEGGRIGRAQRQGAIEGRQRRGGVAEPHQQGSAIVERDRVAQPGRESLFVSREGGLLFVEHQQSTGPARESVHHLRLSHDGAVQPGQGGTIISGTDKNAADQRLQGRAKIGRGRKGGKARRDARSVPCAEIRDGGRDGILGHLP